MTKLYVGNLPYSVRDAELEEIFADYSPIASAVVITDRQTGRSKGFGFVEIEDDDKANQAIEALNGSQMEGRALVVNIARPKVER